MSEAKPHTVPVADRMLTKNFQRERLEVETTELICQLLAERDVSRSELGRRLGRSRSYVTKILRDGSNMTMRTISDIFFALGCSATIVSRPLSPLAIQAIDAREEASLIAAAPEMLACLQEWLPILQGQLDSLPGKELLGGSIAYRTASERLGRMQAAIARALGQPSEALNPTPRSPVPEDYEKLSAEVIPCPSCGGKACPIICRMDGVAAYYYHVRCKWCGEQGREFMSMMSAVENWNAQGAKRSSSD